MHETAKIISEFESDALDIFLVDSEDRPIHEYDPGHWGHPEVTRFREKIKGGKKKGKRKEKGKERRKGEVKEEERNEFLF